jgi:SAM-dependent methyltransferase
MIKKLYSLIRNSQEIQTRDYKISKLKRKLEAAENQITQLTNIVNSLIKRHYRQLELPPEELRLNVGTKTTASNFWLQGINSSSQVLEIFGQKVSEPILDWGCGSGRTLAWLLFSHEYQQHYHGCDVDKLAIEWLKNQGIENVQVCHDDPPLPYPDKMFGNIFSFSVLTHIHPTKHRDWYQELHRILKTGGRAYLTTQGNSVIQNAGHNIPECAKEEFHSQGYTYIENDGHYKDASLVSETYTRKMLEGIFEIEDYQERGYQNMDALILRRLD